MKGHAELKADLYVAVDALLAEQPVPLRDFLEVLSHQEEHPFDVWREVAGHLIGIEPTAVPQKMRFAVKHACWMVIVGHETGRFPSPSEAQPDGTSMKTLLPEDTILELLRCLSVGRELAHQAPS